MKKIMYLLVLACVFGMAGLPLTASAATAGGDQGWYKVHCNVNGAQVYFDGEYQGEITDGVLSVAIYSTGTPYKEYSVSKAGYITDTQPVKGVPDKGETVDLYATLNPVETPVPPVAPIGGDQGWYVVHCNIDGAQVYFDSDLKGQISGGELSVPIYTTGTPYKGYSVQNAGYYPFSETITQYPGKGETVALYATLNPEPGPTKSPLSPLTGIVAISVIGLASAMLLRKEN